jgi:hypothetical protein
MAALGIKWVITIGFAKRGFTAPAALPPVLPVAFNPTVVLAGTVWLLQLELMEVTGIPQEFTTGLYFARMGSLQPVVTAPAPSTALDRTVVQAGIVWRLRSELPKVIGIRQDYTTGLYFARMGHMEPCVTTRVLAIVFDHTAVPAATVWQPLLELSTVIGMLPGAMTGRYFARMGTMELPAIARAP